MPASAWSRLPDVLFRRFAGRPWEGPWIIPAAVDRLGELIQSDWVILELGSGFSTGWYAARSKHVTSFEDDAEWLAEVSRGLTRAGQTNVDLRHRSLRQFPGQIGDLPDASFDLVVIDSNEEEGIDRVTLLEVAMSKVAPGRYLLFDDSDRADYVRATDRLLGGWEAERFVGLKPHPLTCMETSLFRRPVPFPPRHGRGGEELA